MNKQLTFNYGMKDLEDVEAEIKGYRLGTSMPNTTITTEEDQYGNVLVTLSGKYRYEFERFALKFFFGDRALAKTFVEDDTKNVGA